MSAKVQIWGGTRKFQTIIQTIADEIQTLADEIQTIADEIQTIADEIRRLIYFLYNFLSQTLKRFETVIGPSKLRFLAGPSTDKSFQMTIRIYSYKNFRKHNHRI